MSMLKVMRQMPTQVGRATKGGGEAVPEEVSDETCGPRHETQDTGMMPKQREFSLLVAEFI